MLTHTPDVLTESTADTVFALILASARRVVELAEWVKEGNWKASIGEACFGVDVQGKTLGIVGLGRIGGAVARRAALGFRMNVLYTNRSANEQAEKEYGAKRVELDELLAQSDFVCLQVPLTPETRGLIGADELKKMKPSAILINASRGPTVDENALIEALQERHDSRRGPRRVRAGTVARRFAAARDEERRRAAAYRLGHARNASRDGAQRRRESRSAHSTARSRKTSSIATCSGAETRIERACANMRDARRTIMTASRFASRRSACPRPLCPTIPHLTNRQRRIRARRATITDVAREAGTGKTSISRYLNGETGVLSPDLRERIEAAIAKLDYRPNQMARGLKRGRNRLIGMLLADLTNPYSVEVLQGVEAACHALGYMPLICHAANEIDMERRYLQLLTTYRVEGVIVNALGVKEELLQGFAQGGIPVVLVDRSVEGFVTDMVGLDNPAAVQLATRHLVDEGFDELLFIVQPVTHVSSRRLREAAFRETVARARCERLDARDRSRRCIARARGTRCARRGGAKRRASASRFSRRTGRWRCASRCI